MGPVVEDFILKVKASSDVKSLAAAIAHSLEEDIGRPVVLRAIGAGAVNQGVKALCIAQSFVATKGIVLTCRPGMVKVKLADGDVTAITLRVFPE